jgi:hypothetical protein
VRTFDFLLLQAIHAVLTHRLLTAGAFSRDLGFAFGSPDGGRSCIAVSGVLPSLLLVSSAIVVEIPAKIVQKELKATQD